jgi:GTP cyclohydrolase I
MASRNATAMANSIDTILNPMGGLVGRVASHFIICMTCRRNRNTNTVILAKARIQVVA